VASLRHREPQDAASPIGECLAKSPERVADRPIREGVCRFCRPLKQPLQSVQGHAVSPVPNLTGPKLSLSTIAFNRLRQYAL
jgi:hypothetical protein